ncbi:MAG: nitroreductase family protein [Bacteroidales bacterium]|nr:nitroreductase family protein [Bacteroidales bacterium]MDD2571625.1 nitroreductase family protein [Bacteroidales bacterium]MDD2813435.1 nitroreductase family protein [Bacteroidales bacterium]MDD3812656.1 nitroreductase family protein [Bacteroidales bacterium]MDD3872567.1 nitroreductase family protein [Bacteroidales bacterium]
MVNPIKTAATSYPVTDWLRMRWSPRSFSAQEITEHDLLTILEAGTWAFNGGNLQPWFFLYGYKGTEGFKKILSCLNPGNQSWAQNAAVLIVTLAKRERDPGKPNLWSKHDVGAASMGMILQAITMNIYGHPMSGYDPNKIISTLGIDPDVYEPVTCIALGYPGDPGQLNESQRTNELAPRTRKPVGEVSRCL